MLKCSSVLGCQVSFLGCFCWVIVSPFCWLHRSSAKRRRSFCFTLKRVLPIGTKDMGSDVFVELRSAPRKSGWVQDCKDPRWSAKLFIWPQNKTSIYLYIVDTHIEMKSWGLWIYSFLLWWRFSPSKAWRPKHTPIWIPQRFCWWLWLGKISRSSPKNAPIRIPCPKATCLTLIV